jgi:SnoaL-like domain
MTQKLSAKAATRPLSPLQRTWETYASAWRQTQPNEIVRLFDAALARDCTYTDPLSQCEGWEALIAYMTDFHRQVPGGHFVTTRFIEHHQRSVATWQMCDAQGAAIGDGISYGVYDDQNKLTSMVGFFDVPGTLA